MEKRTLRFECLIDMALFSKTIAAGYLLNTNNLTLTGKLTDAEIELAISSYNAEQIQTTDKVFSYEGR